MRAMSPAPDVDSAFAADTFAALSAVMSREVTRYLAEAQSGARERVLPAASRDELLAAAKAALAAAPTAAGARGEVEARFGALARLALANAHGLHDPRSTGHQVAPAMPAAALFDALGRAANQGSAVREMGPFAAAAERAVGDVLGELVGWAPGSFAAVATHGGTLANVTALLAARNARFGDVWRRGFTLGVAPTRPVLLASADAHYSIARAAGILGLGTDAVLKVPVDAERRLDVDAAETAIQRAMTSGLAPFALVASAASTPTGAFDPLREAGALARRYGLWLHVDAAHGGSLLFSPAHRGRLDGVELADSVAWDAHKMLFTPPLLTYLMYRDRTASFGAFEQDAPYLFAADDRERAEWDGGLRTFECTRGAIALSLWGSLALYGRELHAALVERAIARTRWLWETVTADADFRAAHEPQCDIFCFRYEPRGVALDAARRSALQAAIREALLADGRYYVTSTRLDGETWLRVTILHPGVSEDSLRGLLEAVRASGREQLRDG
jgi:L-2,4-diaminobutyrate decarboxylase